MKRLKDTRSDRERITMVVLQAMKFEAMFGGKGLYREWGEMPGPGPLNTVVAWKGHSYEKARIPPDGAIILCDTNPNHRWGVSFFAGVKPEGVDGWVLREPGTDNLLEMGNEGFTVLVGLYPPSLLEGRQKSFWDDLLYASHKVEDRGPRPCAITFDKRFSGREATVTFRRHIWFQKTGPGGVVLDTPLIVSLKIPARRNLKALAAQLEPHFRQHVWYREPA